MYKKILVPLDGSSLAEAVIPHAQDLAKTEGAEIVLLQIPLIPTSEFLARNPDLISNIIEEVEKESKTYLNTEVEKLQLEGLKVSCVMREGPIAETILDVAEETKADMIAMSTHGRSGFKRWLLGSVADRVVHLAHIPVMLIHPN